MYSPRDCGSDWLETSSCPEQAITVVVVSVENAETLSQPSYPVSWETSQNTKPITKHTSQISVHLFSDENLITVSVGLLSFDEGMCSDK